MKILILNYEMGVLDSYQEKLIDATGRALLISNSVVAQSETGSGKTVIFSTITNRYISKSTKDVIIFVHKMELLEQTRQALYEWYGIVSQKIDSDTKVIEPVRVFVAMVETFNNRSQHGKFLDKFKNIGMIIIDECHLSNFKKIFIHFTDALRIGFTATPISATKKDPLKNYYKSIVIGPKITELFEVNSINPQRGLVPVITRSLKNINRADLKMKGEEFEEESMGKVFSKPEQIQNTIDAYIKYAYGKKTVCFNASRDHSLKMHKAFLDAGLNSRNLDSTMSTEYRKSCFKWLKETANAILCNVGIATTGFDEKSIECIIVNKSIVSFTLWRQINGRGARAYVFPNGTIKEDFLCLDMGDNVVGGGHGEWSDDQDWEFIFYNPKEPRPGVPAVKKCPNCGAIIYASARVCKSIEDNWFTNEEEECGYEFPVTEKLEDLTPKEMVLISKGIDIKSNIEFFRDKGDYFVYHETIRQVANLARTEIQDNDIDFFKLDHIVNIAIDKASQWFKMTKRRKIPHFKEDVKNKVIKHLQDFGFTISLEEIELLNQN